MKKPIGTNPMEGSNREDLPPPAPSEKSFGLVFLVLFLLIEIVLFFKRGFFAHWPLVLALLLAVALLVKPQILRPLNLLWFRFGLLLHFFISPLVLGALFYGVVSPIGLLMRAFGKDPMKRAWEPEAETYWMKRPVNESPSSMKDPF
jgi:hypothetical protein